MNTPSTYPLDWPQGWERTPSHERAAGRYKYMRGSGSGKKPLTMHVAQKLLHDELRKLGGEHLVVSSNLVKNLDGSIRSGQRAPEDPGIAIFFLLDGKAQTMAMDDFTEPESNVRRLALALGHLRGLKRDGGARMMERAFSGFNSLPAPISGGQPYYVTLNVSSDASLAECKAARNRLARQYHSDKGEGSDGKMTAINVAYDQAKAALS